MGHIAEKGVLVLLASPGGLQGLLQQLLLLEAALFFLLHLPEAEHHLLRGEGFVEQHPHVHPAVGGPEEPPEISAEIPHAPGHQAADAGQGEILHILVVGLRLDQLLHDLQQSLVVPLLGDSLPHVVGSLDHLVGALGEIDAVQGKIGVAQHPHRLVGPPHPGV